jgi:single-strand DNA-binding protein
MSRGVNTVILLGNCGNDPEIRYTASGKAVAKLSLAVNESFKDSRGEWQERTHWINVVAWQRLAEIVGEHVQRGTRIFVQGRLNTESWDDRRSGDKRYRTSVVAEKLVILSNGNGNRAKNQGPDSEPLKREPCKQKMNAKEPPAAFSDADIPF